MPDGGRRAVRPDAWAQLVLVRPGGTSQRCLLLEHDRASLYQRQLREKIRALLAYRHDAYRRLFGTESISVLFTVPTAERRAQVLAYLEAEVAAHERRTGAKVDPDLFWVSERDPRRGADLFAAPGWFHPFRDAPRPLVDLPGPAAAARRAPSARACSRSRQRWLVPGTSRHRLRGVEQRRGGGRVRHRHRRVGDDPLVPELRERDPRGPPAKPLRATPNAPTPAVCVGREGALLPNLLARAKAVRSGEPLRRRPPPTQPYRGSEGRGFAEDRCMVNLLLIPRRRHSRPDG